MSTWSVKHCSACSGCRRHLTVKVKGPQIKPQGHTGAESEAQANLISSCPDIWKAFWCGMRSWAMFVVFLPLHCCKSVHWALSLTASHCSSLFTLSSFSLSAFFLFYLPFLSLLFICLAMLEMLCVAVACMCISLKCRALCSEWSSSSQAPLPNHHHHLTVRLLSE